MKFGVFDHMDRAGTELAQQYRDRLTLVEAYENHGFHAYHLAEHHATPLGQAPSPSVFLSAVAQRTTTLRFGPLVYALNLHHPIRVLEEICMLDQLSGGRLELGLGRGISPFELRSLGVDPSDAASRYREVRQIILEGLATGRVDFAGAHYDFHDVQLEVGPVQRPHPPLWYGVGRAEGAADAAREGASIVVSGTVQEVRVIADRYREAWWEAGRPGGEPLIGMSRHVVVAEDERRALDLARRAYERWHFHLLYLWRRNNARPAQMHFPERFDEAREAGLCLVGTPAMVREAAERQIAASGVNYLVCRMAFGDLALADSLRSVGLFAEAVIAPLAGNALPTKASATVSPARLS